MKVINLLGEIVETEERNASHHVVGDCDKRCLEAKEERCDCRCGGRNHGFLVKTSRNQSLDGERYIAIYDDELWKLFKACLICGYPHLEILGYPHPDGLYLKQYDMKIWVFGRCLKCSYDNAWWKYSLPRALVTAP